MARAAQATRDTIRPTSPFAALVLGAIGGMCALLAFPPYDLWMLLPVAIAALNAALLTRRWWAGALGALTWGLAFFIPLTNWANIYAGAMPWIALGVFEALYIVLYGVLARIVMVRRGLGLGTAVIVAALWTGAETLRSTFPWGGLPWGASGFALQSSPLLNLGPWVGMAGLAFAVALLGQLLLGGALALAQRRSTGVVGLSGVWPLATACGAVLASLVVPLPSNPAPSGEQTTLSIAGIQGNMAPIDPQALTMSEETFPNHLAATEDAIAQVRAAGGRLDLVVWPEDSTGWDPREDGWRGEAITDVARDAQAPVLVGTQTLVEDDTARLNSALLWTPDGEVAATYSKRHPVPFGEYIPARGFFRMLTDKVDLISVDMIPGDAVGVLDVQGHPVGVLICFEIAYQDLVQDTVRSGAQVIVVQSNNALFGDSHEAVQQLAEAKVFAVISGRSVVHVSTVGDSAIFTPTGRVLDSQAHWTQGSVIADVPLATGITPAIAAGAWPAIALSALGALGVLLSLMTRTRAIAVRPETVRREPVGRAASAPSARGSRR
ncbi:apolipoprotein N-acyltransferase [Brachybacterium sp. JHP9]|uniref:Apolipoprotein N-acyltransferase n=1 Tax=Brachybacterium equifaecis TaxID=2910770 RepID=A0ABT0R2F9_9MICO|nr:apolipoprotein N-acyltransferase [Brachybacterium equifaecis]MCL6424125.1 apolipoprotein N-acyltransferase [Brachybacterium equifaecis]